MTDDERLEHAFVQGAQWWEYDQTEFTMWPSDRARAYGQAKKLREAGDLGLSQHERLAKIQAARERMEP